MAPTIRLFAELRIGALSRQAGMLACELEELVELGSATAKPKHLVPGVVGSVDTMVVSEMSKNWGTFWGSSF